MKRFWKTAEAVADDSGWGVQLDGRPVRTPSKTLLSVPTEALGRRHRGRMEFVPRMTSIRAQCR